MADETVKNVIANMYAHADAQQMQNNLNALVDDVITKSKMKISMQSECGLIICCPSSVVYRNQTGGYACLHPEAEGAFIPISNPEFSKKLEDYFCGPKWNGWCSDGIDIETADWVDKALVDQGLPLIRVDRARMKDSHEAWVFVVIDASSQNEYAWISKGPADACAILTWQNSD